MKKEKEVITHGMDIKAESSGSGSRAVNKFRISDAVLMLIILILCLTCVLPFIHLAAKSVSSNSYVLAQQVFLWPKGLNIDAYVSVLQDGSMTSSLLFTIGITVVFTALGMLVCICAAYPLSKRRLKGRTVLTFLLMFPLYFSAGLIPSFLLYRDLNIYDTAWVLILPLIYSPYNMLIMKSYLQSNIPASLEESAFIDGGTNIQILMKVALPLSKPIIATLSLFYAVGRWNAYADNLYFTRRDDLKMLQYRLYKLVASAREAQAAGLAEGVTVTSTAETLHAAMIMFATIPILVVYPFAQKYFVKGVMIGAVKG